MLDDSDEIYAHIGWIHFQAPLPLWMINFLQLTQACCYHYFKVILRVHKGTRRHLGGNEKRFLRDLLSDNQNGNLVAILCTKFQLQSRAIQS
jgi:hypothetical protein